MSPVKENPPDGGPKRSLRLSDGMRRALMTHGTAIVVALITSAATVVTSLGNVHTATKDATSASAIANHAAEKAQVAAEKANGEVIPIGAIVASTLAWEEFSTSSGSRADFAAGESAWTPCDGRSIAGSKASLTYRLNRAPDLRGVFLRGLNEFVPGYTQPLDPSRADPATSRTAGSYQADELRKHRHTLPYQKWALKNGDKVLDLEETTNEKGRVSTDDAGGDETRPKNVAVYYYMRIN